MSEYRSTSPQRLLEDFRLMVERRAEARQACLADHQAERARIESSSRRQIEESKSHHQEQLSEAEQSYRESVSRESDEFSSKLQALKAEEQAELLKIQRDYDRGIAEIDQKLSDAEWMMDTVYDGGGDSPVAHYEALQSQTERTREFLQANWKTAESCYRQAVATLTARRQTLPETTAEPLTQSLAPGECVEWFEQAVQRVDQLRAQIDGHWISRLFLSLRPVVLAFSCLLIATTIAIGVKSDPLAVVLRPDTVDWPWVAVSLGIGTGVSVLCLLTLYLISRVQLHGHYRRMVSQLGMARAVFDRWRTQIDGELESSRTEADDWLRETETQRAVARNRARQAVDDRRRNLQVTRDAGLKHARTFWPLRIEQVRAVHDQRMQQFENRYSALVSQVKQQGAEQLRQIESSRDQALAAVDATREERWQRMVTQWQADRDQWFQRLEELQAAAARNQPAWSDLLESGWESPDDSPDCLGLGNFLLETNRFDELQCAEPELRLETDRLLIPSVLPLDSDPSLLIETEGAGREAAISVLKSAMLRLLTSVPAGKIRFTVIDPVGLGEAFSGFMHLADFDELMIGSRIWTEPNQIEKRLSLLTEHMENVFQTYLRDEFATIQEYNEHACEVAEPFQVLVVANFPANFTESAARRLISIAASGARCGVFTLLSLDRRQPLPQGFDLDDLRANSQRLSWKKDHFQWEAPELKHYALQLDPLPPGEQLARIVRSVGDQSRDARRVEVSFDRIAPRTAGYWSSDSRHGIDIPLGRAGATKLQHMRLGKGTSQHVLIAGKTGSGKSTFLHTLITNVALHYSPHEVEFYLVDFKKGVEFKTYVSEGLPHARVVAIESDREFGLSVLERLDQVLRERGDVFREAGVQDLPSFRDQRPAERMPRILFIVDEFQEFFVEDDRVAHQSALLLDRLVRQGRAFGIHVLLGSQTLGGAYSLARSTLGQVAVRIALQCSETDAHLILSEENTAARLLTRPGEAIYNDANGLLEGNHTFQVAFLDERQRDRYLARIRNLATRQQIDSPARVVFEGQRPAILQQNPEILSSRQQSASAPWPDPLPLWLGDAVSIKPPTSCPLSRRAGSNIILCGQNPAAAEGMFAAILLSWLAVAPENCRVDPEVLNRRLVCFRSNANGLPGWESWLSDSLPAVQQVSETDLERRLDELLDEIDARVEQPDRATDPSLLFFPNISGFRQLRRSEDDYGFGSFGEQKEATVSQKFARILQEGPDVGMHTVVWSDTFANLNRWLSSQTLREFEIRIAFQMNATDSSSLIDTPTASQLGPHRGLLYRLDDGSLERFRPYSLPDREWTRSFSAAFQAEPEPDVCEDIDMWTVT